jgi:hypothetical protein
MVTMKSSLLALLPCTIAIVSAQQGAYAPLGTATRFTNLTGSVGLDDGKNGLEITNKLHGLTPNKKYDLYLLAASCPARAPLNDDDTAKLRVAISKAKRLGTIDSNAGTIPLVSGLTVGSVMSKGLLLVEAGKPVECADIAPVSFGPPPAPPPGAK